MPIDPTDRELEYRANNYQDFEAINRKQIVCATCGTSLRNKLEKPGGVFIHPLMTTLQCKKCSDFYGDGEFSMDEDGDDKYCRMCGNGGELYLCGNKPCPYGFCQKCITRYLGSNSSEVEADDWKCLHCNSKPLWEVRAVCAVILLERSKKRWKKNKRSSRSEVNTSDHDCGHSEDSDFTRSKRLQLPQLRNASKKEKKITEKLKRTRKYSSDSSNSADALSEDRRKSNLRGTLVKSEDKKSSASKTTNAKLSNKGKNIREILSDIDGSDDSEKEEMKKKISNNTDKQSNRSSSVSFNERQMKKPKSKEKSNKKSKSQKDEVSSSDESSHESANDFVESKNKKNLKTQKEKLSPKNAKIRKTRSNRSENSAPKPDLNDTNKQSNHVAEKRRTRESFSESEDTKLEDNKLRSRHTDADLAGKKVQKRRTDIIESDEDRDDLNKDVKIRKRSKLQETMNNKKHSGSTNKDSQTEVRSQSNSKPSTSAVSKTELQETSQTTKSSTTLSQISRIPLPLLDYNDEILNKKKSRIKLSYAKHASTEDKVTENQVAIISNHINDLISELNLIGKGLCTAANDIAKNFPLKNATSVSQIYKTVFKCSLLMLRCKMGLGIIDQEFTTSYDTWCKNCNFKNFLVDAENIESATNNEQEPNIEAQIPNNISENKECGNDRVPEKIVDEVDKNLDDSNRDENSQTSRQSSDLDFSPIRKTDNSKSDGCRTLDESDEDSNNSKRSTEQKKPIQNTENSHNSQSSKNSSQADEHISDCDDKEIFSEDESCGLTDKDDQPIGETITAELTSSNTKSNDKADETESNSRGEEPMQCHDNIEKGLETPENDSADENEECAAESLRVVDIEKRLETAGGDSADDNEECAAESSKVVDIEKRLEMSEDDSADDNEECAAESSKVVDIEKRLEMPENDNADDNEECAAESSKVVDIEKRLESLENDSADDNEECAAEPSGVVDVVGNMSEADTSVNDILEDSTLKDFPMHDNTINDSVADTSAITERLSETEITLETETKSSENKERSPPSSPENDERGKTLPDDCSSNKNEDANDLSDCDEQMIFTQTPTEDFANSSKVNDIVRKTRPVENVQDSSDTYISEPEIESNNKMQLQKDKKASPSKQKDEGISDSDDDKVKGDSEDSETPKNSGVLKKRKNPAELSDDRVSATVDGQEESVSESEQDETKLSNESDEAIKRRILESDDSDLTNESETSSTRSDSLELRLNTDSEDMKKEPDSPKSQVSTSASHASLNLSEANKSEIMSSRIRPEDINTSEESSKNTANPKTKDGEFALNIANNETNDLDYELNNLAKHRLLSSSSDSDSDKTITNLTPNFDHTDSCSSSLQENDENTSPSTNKILSTKVKRKKLILKKNYFYKTDKKLQMICQVVVRRLGESVLDQFRQTLCKSKERKEWKELQSLIDLSNIKKGKRGTVESNLSESSSDSSSTESDHTRKRSKQVQEKEETLLEHLEQMKNGENYCNLSGDESNENNDTLLKNYPRDTTEEELISRANQAAKDLLIQSSDSENEKESSTGDKDEDEEEEVETESKKKKKTEREKNDDANDDAAESESNHENGSKSDKEDEEELVEPKSEAKGSDDSDSDRTREKKKLKKELSKRNWRLTDSDTSGDEKKWNKSQAKLEKSAAANEDDELELEGSKKKKKRAKRQVFGSDSDAVKLTDDDDDSVEMIGEKKKSGSDSEDSGELFKSLRKKSKRKRNAAKKSDSDSESTEEEKRPKQKRKRIKKMDSDSNSDSDTLNNSQDTPGKFHRKNIRKVLKDKQVADDTKIAGKEEEERLRRIAERQKLYNEMYEMKLASEAKVDKLVLDFDEETKKELVGVHEGLVKRLKPHQAQGIKFMWDACFESLERTKSTKGSGCIVAHCMGLGKTFQVVTLSHTLLTHAETGIKTIMVICPLSTVLNWVNEFKKWLGDINNDEDVRVFEMTKMKKHFERKAQLQKWKRLGGVMVLGYEMFRLLSNQTGKKMRKSQHEEILKCLVDPGPDLIVCDEGHLLKNEDTALSKAMRRVKTLRRIVLTGTPLQNNLVEYHCMVQFVKPNLLGTKKEFLNRFVNPITNGQFDDSTEYDVKLMKKRAHVLHKMLEGSVQRFDYSVLTPFLPPKQEYVITVRLADIQIKLYQYYLDNFSRKKVGAGTSLFADFQALQRIWTHPIVLRMNAEKMEKLNEKRRMDASDSEGSLRDFLDDGTDEKTTSSDDSDVESVRSSDEKPDKPRRGTRANPIDLDEDPVLEEEQPQAGEWWSQFIEPEHFEDLKISSKLVLLFAILKECEQIGDKVLVFSQSLYALSLIEEFLNKIDDETQRGTCSDLIDNHSGSWSLGLDYFRLDGQTAPENRSQYCKIFNNPKNSRARLFLISTRAGGLGINLTAANRVIIFDASWNPSHDVQSIFRIYRFGQKKPCYVYRFLAQGTMEEKIYNRQVTKLSLSCRVVDEQQIERHYSNHDLAELYQFEPNTSMDKPTLNLPKDRLLAEIFRKYEDRIETFHEHDSLLENKAEEELDEEERKEAWKEYEDERKGRKVYMNNFQTQNFAMQQYDMLNMNQADIANRATLSGINIETLQALIQKDYPNTTPEQQKMMTQRAIMDMYTYMENEAIRQQRLAAAASNFNYPTVSNLGTTSFIDKNAMTPAQRQYALQQQQMHQMMVQREQQANYAKRFGNVRGTGVPVATTRPPPLVQLEDSDIMEVTVPAASTAGPVASSSVPTSSAPAAPAPAENSKRQEE